MPLFVSHSVDTERRESSLVKSDHICKIINHKGKIWILFCFYSLYFDGLYYS